MNLNSTNSGGPGPWWAGSLWSGLSRYPIRERRVLERGSGLRQQCWPPAWQQRPLGSKGNGEGQKCMGLLSGSTHDVGNGSSQSCPPGAPPSIAPWSSEGTIGTCQALEVNKTFSLQETTGQGASCQAHAKEVTAQVARKGVTPLTGPRGRTLLEDISLNPLTLPFPLQIY